jgi:hypothetical protein
MKQGENDMKRVSLFALIAVVVVMITLSIASFAQDQLVIALPQHTPKAELSLGYSYLNQNTKLAFTSPQGFFQSFLGGINGGNASIAFNLNSVIGIKADVAGYSQSPNFSSNVFTFAAGPIIKKHSGVFNPFAELLVGVAHKSVSGLTFDGGQNAFTGIAGGGIDLKLSRHFSVRAAEVDYVWTALHTVNPTDYLIVSSRQNNFRYSGGVVFAF